MRKRRFVLPGLAVLLSAVLCGCNPKPNPTPPPSVVANPPPGPSTPSAPTQPAARTPIKDAVTQLLADQAKRSDSPFPPGTRLLGVNLKDGLVTLDFSKEFKSLDNMGESTDMRARNMLRKTLSHFSNVEKMRATVEGQPFVTEFEWSEPFTIRINDGMSKSDSKVGVPGNNEGGQ